MENIIEYYIIIGLSFIITSYIVTYRPAMRLVAEALLDRLNKTGTSDDFLLNKIEVFTSLPYRVFTLLIYLLTVFIAYPIVAISTIFKNDTLIKGFSAGILNGLLKNE